jgi:predicted nucleotidyltransferase
MVILQTEIVPAMTVLLPKSARLFVELVAAVNPPPKSIWLIGSRANGRANEESDTDLLVFGSPVFEANLKSQISAPTKIDCLVVHDGDNYREPWQDKTGALAELNWRLTSPTRAEYEGTKWVTDEDSSSEFGSDMGRVEVRKEVAVKVWPTK